MPKIWIVDDDVAVRLAYNRTLAVAGYAVMECTDGADLLEKLKGGMPDLIILDVEMPRLDGWGALAELRRRNVPCPVLMLTHVNEIASRVRGLDLGADDYIGKPCSPHELVARVRALLRRASRAALEANPGLLRLGDVTIDLTGKTAAKAGAPLRLTRTDFVLLELLNARRGKPVSREVILHEVWGGKSRGSHALDTHLWRLRKKIGDTGEVSPWIQNVPGIGYVLNSNAD